MEIKLYTSRGCSHCFHVKTLLERAKLEWEEIEIGVDISMEIFKSQYPSINATPFILIDGVEYIGIVEVAKKFLKEGIIEAPKVSEPE
jgi:glutaredoxin